MQKFLERQGAHKKQKSEWGKASAEGRNKAVCRPKRQKKRIYQHQSRKAKKPFN